ncbi:GNAT family N-acetyltransferase [Massilia glaciei]|uniref:N-acetyltransferase n=1 Tax=Massilia glaciei TaxID=1524097 RepID=A0A2U2I5D0_9BURK|nr:GNAT family protein [Massilia glaciei]PWF54994.1 N-acetyltransferase [Massilia glaciei]
MLKGSLCTVRHIVSTDLDTYISLYNDLSTRGEFFSTQLRAPENIRQEFAKTGMVTDEREHFLLEDTTGNIVGLISHFKSRTPICREIGYRMLVPAASGRGIMTEATRMLCDHLFMTYAYNRLELLMDPENTGSERIAQKCGFTCEGTMRGGFFTRGTIRDAKVYSLLRAEWEAGAKFEAGGWRLNVRLPPEL